MKTTGLMLSTPLSPHSSTIAMELAMISLLSTMDEPPAKRVRFSFTHAVQDDIEEPTIVEQDEEEKTWYSSEDFAEFQTTARNLCRDIHLGSCSKKRILDENPFNKNNQMADDDSLQESQTIRGLEVIANPTVGRRRMLQRCGVIQSVLIAQDTVRQTDEVENVDTFIAFFAEKESATARQFAQVMGKADETAILRPRGPPQSITKVVAPSA
jgi:hypothetical protein